MRGKYTALLLLLFVLGAFAPSAAYSKDTAKRAPSSLCAQLLIDPDKAYPFSIETIRHKAPVQDQFKSMVKKARAYSKKGDTAAIVAEISELPRVHLAVFTDAATMNVALDRATSYIFFRRAGSKNPSLRSDQSILYPRLKMSTVGHDLYGDKLLEFLKAWCPTRHEDIPARLQIEARFWDEMVIPRLEQDRDMILIAVNLEDDPRVVLSHEILHAHFASTPEVREVVAEYWEKEVSAGDKAKIKKALVGYNPDDLYLMHNEFYAYLFQAEPEEGLLKKFVKTHREKLLARLYEAGAAPLEISL